MFALIFKLNLMAIDIFNQVSMWISIPLIITCLLLIKALFNENTNIKTNKINNESAVIKFIEYLITNNDIEDEYELKGFLNKQKNKYYQDYLDFTFKLNPVHRGKFSFIIQDKKNYSERKVILATVKIKNNKIVLVNLEHLLTYDLYNIKVNKLIKWQKAFNEYDQYFKINKGTETTRIVNFLAEHKTDKMKIPEYNDMIKFMSTAQREELDKKEKELKQTEKEFEKFKNVLIEQNRISAKTILEEVQK